MLSFRRCRFPLTVFTLFCCIINKGNGLLITKIIVPSQIQYGSKVVLRCLYDLDGYSLYSVKWYKGSHEFFRFVPSEVFKFRVFPWSNFTIDYDPEEKGKVHLMNVTQDAEGQYKCEVSTEGPKFDTDFKEANMSVYDISSDGPVLSANGRYEFDVNQVLNFTCSFKKSRPKPKLTWRIDGQEVMTHERRYVMDSPEGLDWWSVDSDLSVLVNATYVQRKVLSVSCTASVGSVYEKTTTLKYTARTPALALPPPPQPPHTFSVDVVSASMASSHHDGKDAYSAGQRRRRRSEELLAVVLVELWLIVALSALLS